MQEIPPVLPSAGKRAHAIRIAPHTPARTVPHKGTDVRRSPEPGKFEIVRVDGGKFIIRMLDGNGAVLALSRAYPDIAAAVHGVEAVRECAAAAHISDGTARSPAPEPLTPPLQ